MDTSNVLRQGDIFIKPIDKLPEGLKKFDQKKTEGRIILQHSETSGNHHHFQSNAAVDLYQMSDEPVYKEGVTTITDNFRKFIVVKGDGATLYHGKSKTFHDDPVALKTGDHHALRILPGIYEIDITREYNYDEMEVSRVVD